MGNAKNTEWQHVTFADIAESITERVDDPKEAGVEVYVGLEHLDSNTTRISRFGTPDDVEASKLRFYPGDVIYARRRAYQRKLGVAEVEGICSAHALVLRARPDVCLPEFLPYFLQSDQFHERALEISVGSLSPTINWKTLRVQEFVLPPVEEQGRIANLLETVSRASQTTESALELANRLLCTLAAVLTEVSGPDVRALTDVAEILDSMRVPLNATERAERVGEVPYFGANGQVGTVDTPIFNEPLTLIPEDGGYFSQWRTEAIAYRIDGPSWVNNHAHVIRAREVPNGWLYFSFRNRDMTKSIVGTTRTKLNKSSLERLEIAIPENLHERLKTLEQSNTLVQILRSRLNAVESLKQHILSDLMNPGEHV